MGAQRVVQVMQDRPVLQPARLHYGQQPFYEAAPVRAVAAERMLAPQHSPAQQPLRVVVGRLDPLRDYEPPYRRHQPPLDGYRHQYGELAALGIAKGKPFAPDARMKRILEQAAKTGLAQMRAQSFADCRPDRVVWKDRKWEWAALRYEDGFFNTANYVDLE